MAPTISGTPQVGMTLTDSSGNTGVLYQWRRCDTATPPNCTDITGAGGNKVSYVVTTDDLGSRLEVRELAGGSATADSAPTAVVTFPPPASTAPPTIAGAPVLGATLTETHGGWTNSPTSYAIQWVDCDGAGNLCTPIPGATAQTYVLVTADLGHTIRVFEVAVNGGGTSLPVATGPTGVVAAPPVSTARPTVSGKAVVGGTLACTTGAWQGTQPLSYTYVWLGDGNPHRRGDGQPAQAGADRRGPGDRVRGDGDERGGERDGAELHGARHRGAGVLRADRAVARDLQGAERRAGGAAQVQRDLLVDERRQGAQGGVRGPSQAHLQAGGGERQVPVDQEQEQAGGVRGPGPEDHEVGQAGRVGPRRAGLAGPMAAM